MGDVKHIQPVLPPYPFEDYARLVSPLSEEDGGGYLVTFPDLPGVMADGDSVEDALHNARDAFESDIAAMVGLRPLGARGIVQVAQAETERRASVAGFRAGLSFTSALATSSMQGFGSFSVHRHTRHSDVQRRMGSGLRLRVRSTKLDLLWRMPGILYSRSRSSRS
ncbi:type II toxin-antitoxin system HicB family antitoxin [Azohydromonas lata]|uniref:Type II toxin-antitoxin system HicB family antitoxin n=1 Tax=Azohydromonas lata TaxID=45677 RepID=A0ABU5IG19_9BURK|nr:type II toxin-antitoxin system HicB family antitoxin [Azohydromonas lata]MDZ5458071.1 type II toxin-antitoxin system HicB family antitoxin [Azohydromonas lata]